MSAFHHRGLLIDRDGPRLRYRFCPEYLVEPEVCGEFDFNICDGETEVVSPSNWEWGKRHDFDKVCAQRLARKIRENFRATGLYPLFVYYIA